MFNQQKEPLFFLIKTLSKAEKRNFRLYVNRMGNTEQIKFVKLFDVLDRSTEYDESALLKKLPAISKRQLPNLKRHLYKQLLTSLRLIHIQKEKDIEIREQIDFARILYGKGMYYQSLKILDRAKQLAMDGHEDILHLQIVEFEKLIESRHITRSIENRSIYLAVESEKRNQVIGNTSKLSNMALKLYGLYLKVGHIDQEKDLYMVREFFRSNFTDINPDKLTFFEKIYLYQSFFWYHHILQNFPYCYKYARRWVELFKNNPEMKKKDPDLYMRGLHNLLINLHYLNNHSLLMAYLKELEDFVEENEGQFNMNSKILAFQFIFISKMDQHFLDGSFENGLLVVKQLESEFSFFKPFIDQHHVMLFYYKSACMYFCSGQFEKSLDYLNLIIDIKVPSLRTDIQSYARMLKLIVHYELEHNELLSHLVISTYRYLKSKEDINKVQRAIIRFLRASLNRKPDELEPDFVELKKELEKYREEPNEMRSFLYLDIVAWLESKINNKSIGLVIQERFAEFNPKR